MTFLASITKSKIQKNTNKTFLFSRPKKQCLEIIVNAVAINPISKGDILV